MSTDKRLDKVLAEIKGGVQWVSGFDAGFNDDDVKRIAEAMKKSTSRMLTLSTNRITDVGAMAIAEAIEQSSSLEQIRLGYNKITDVGALALARVIEKSKTLQVVNLTCNKITDVGMLALAKAMQRSPVITMIHVYFNPMSCVGQIAIHCVVVQVPDRRRLMAFVCGESMRENAAEKLLRNDGDHAIMTRVLQFLLLQNETLKWS